MLVGSGGKSEMKMVRDLTTCPGLAHTQERLKWLPDIQEGYIIGIEEQYQSHLRFASLWLAEIHQQSALFGFR
jgi:hypothetical protein